MIIKEEIELLAIRNKKKVKYENSAGWLTLYKILPIDWSINQKLIKSDLCVTTYNKKKYEKHKHD